MQTRTGDERPRVVLFFFILSVLVTSKGDVQCTCALEMKHSTSRKVNKFVRRATLDVFCARAAAI